MPIKGRSAKAKGTKGETEIVKDLKGVGVPAHRQPGSGAFQGWPDDVIIDSHGWDCHIEVKRRAKDSAYVRYEGARDGRDCAVIDTTAGQFIWMTHEAFLRLIAQAYGRQRPGVDDMSIGYKQIGTAAKQYENWRQGAHLLAIRLDHHEWRWWMPRAFFWELVNHAAQGSFRERGEMEAAHAE